MKLNNEAPRSKLRGIKAELRRSQPAFALKNFGAVRHAIHPYSKLQGILAKANKLWLTLLFVLFIIFGATLPFHLNAKSEDTPSDQALMTSMGIVRVSQKVKAPDFMLRDLAGKMVRLSDLRGKVVLVNFWTTW
jgi:hypothetical protein